MHRVQGCCDAVAHDIGYHHDQTVVAQHFAAAEVTRDMAGRGVDGGQLDTVIVWHFGMHGNVLDGSSLLEVLQ